MTALVLDTHVVQWWSAEPDRLSDTAADAVAQASELAVAAITWYELAWLARHDRISVRIPVRRWLDGLAEQLRTLPLTPAIADGAAGLSTTFPGDAADRLIYSSAREHGLRLVTKDGRLRQAAGATALW